MLSQRNVGMPKKGFQSKEDFINPERFPEATRIFLLAENLRVDNRIFNHEHDFTYNVDTGLMV